MKKTFWLLILPFLFISCAKDYYNTFQTTSDGKEYGSLVVKFSNPIRNVNITVNDILVAEDKFTKRVEVDNIPVGKHEIKVIASSWELKNDINKIEEIDIQVYGKRTMLVQVPPKSTGYWIYQAVTFSVIFSTTYYFYY